jgi:excisionase family DNA binding protein
MKISKIATAEVCTTQEAADILGISVSSVQQLVEAGVIEAWKTKGGHRRIPLAAVEAYKVSPGASVESSAHPFKPAAVTVSNGRTMVLVIEDNKMQQELYLRTLGAWSLPLDLVFCDNGYKALIEIARNKPDVVLADIVMDGIDGYEVVKTILGYPELDDVSIAILSSLSEDELQDRGGLPPGVVFFQKPVNFDEIRGYLRSCCARKERQSR